MAAYYLPEEYKQMAECRRCGWRGDALDLIQHKDSPSRVMRCETCTIETVHRPTHNGWMCWCGSERDEE